MFKKQGKPSSSDLKQLKRLAQVLGLTIKKSRSGYSLIVDEDGSRPLGNEVSLEEIEKHLANYASDLGIDEDDIEFSVAIRGKYTGVKEKTLRYLRANGVDPEEFSQWSDDREIAMGDRGMDSARFDRVSDHQTYVDEFGRPPRSAPGVSDASGGGTGLKNESSRARRNRSLIFRLHPQTAKQWAAFIRRVKRFLKSRIVDDLLPPPAKPKVAPLTVKHQDDYWSQRRGHEEWYSLAAESTPPARSEDGELGADWTPEQRIKYNERAKGRAASRAARRARREQERDRAIAAKVVADDLAGVAARNKIVTRLTGDIANGPDHFEDQTGVSHEFIRPPRGHDPRPQPSTGFAREKRRIGRFGRLGDGRCVSIQEPFGISVRRVFDQKILISGATKSCGPLGALLAMVGTHLDFPCKNSSRGQASCIITLSGIRLLVHAGRS